MSTPAQRVEVANAQFRVHRALIELRSAIDASQVPDLAEWTRIIESVDRLTRYVERAFAYAQQLDPYDHYDDFGPLSEPSAARDRHDNRGAVLVSASPTAPTPATVGIRAFGSSRPHTVNPFKRPLDFGSSPPHTDSETTGDPE